nr:DUF2312 domain-containing protein [Mesorhizobium sp. M6A.T.Ce.TU.016.01.1.1]
MTYDPYNPRVPKKDGKPKGKAKPEQLPPEVTRRAKGDSEPTISIRSSDGQSTGEIPMSVVKAALKVVKGGKDEDPTKEMFDADETGESAAQTVAAGQLRAFVERIERLEEEKKNIADDIKEVFAEAKGTGFDTKAMRSIIRLRKKDQAERQEEEAILDLYKAALGMV